jgi:hypothetical protein
MDAALEPNMMESHKAFIIYPRWNGGEWVFDDPRYEVENEPFVKGANVLLEAILQHAGINLASAKDSGFRLKFSSKFFTGAHDIWSLRSFEAGGTWYASALTGGQLGWLCEVLTRYFGSSPEYLYIAASQGGGTRT